MACTFPATCFFLLSYRLRLAGTFRLINIDFCGFFRFAPSCNTRGHCYKLFAEQSTRNVRYHFFARRVVGTWNRLPVDIDFSSLARFKASVKRTDLSNCLLYCVN